MKRIVYILAFALLLAGASSCSGARLMSQAQPGAAHLYGSSPLSDSYANVHQRAPID